MTTNESDLHHFIVVSLLFSSESPFSPLFNARTRNSNLTLGKEEFKFPPKDGFVALSKAPEGFVVKSQHTGRYCTPGAEGFKKGVVRTPVTRLSQ